MRPVRPELMIRSAVRASAATALVMIAFQLAGKATRDALFLSTHTVSQLPAMVAGSAVLSVLLALVFSRWMTSRGPSRVVPRVFAASGLLLVGEWYLATRARGPAAVIAYLHIGSLGAVVISGFWALLNETFDPRTAKRQVARIASGSALGGLAGGLLAERAAAWLSVTAMLPILGAMHLVCALLALRVSASGAAAPQPEERDRPGLGASLRGIGGSPFIRSLATLVILGTVAETLLDYAFKATAAGASGGGESLLRLFAVFYTVTGLVTLGLQTTVGSAALRGLGLARTVALLPASVAAGALFGLAFPGAAPVFAARGAESALRNGLYRPAYELFYVPVAAGLRRATKLLVDIGAVRLGDVLGAAAVQALILAVGNQSVRPVLALTSVVALFTLVVALRLKSGYLGTLEGSLLRQGGRLDAALSDEPALNSAVLLAVPAAMGADSGTDLPVVADEPAEPPAPPSTATSPGEQPRDPELARIEALASRDAERARRALRAGPLAPGAAAYAVRLLGWDAVSGEAIDALRQAAPLVTGQLLDRLLDPNEDFTIRRRIPLTLADCATERAAGGLIRGLEDPRFEVRYRCGRVLSRLTELDPALPVPRERVVAAVLREVAVDRGVWESYRILDRGEDESWSPVLDEVLRDRADRALEHVFTLLALILPREPLRVSFHGLHTDDPHLRGTALEYLESTLPAEIRTQLWPFLEPEEVRRQSGRPVGDLLDELLRSNQSIMANLEQVRSREGRGREGGQ